MRRKQVSNITITEEKALQIYSYHSEKKTVSNIAFTEKETLANIAIRQ